MDSRFSALDLLETLIPLIPDPLASELKNVATDLGKQIHEVQQETERLARAQAEALVNSAMIMSELQTARSELEEAHALTQSTNHALQRALDSAQVNERRFRLLSDAAPVGIFQMDRTDQCIYMNAGLLQILGVTAKEQLKDWRFFLAPEDRAKAAEQWSLAISEHHEFAGEFRVVTQGGAVRWVLVCARPLFVPENSYDGYIGTLTDITEHKRVEQLKDELVSTVSHELRTPLTSLRGFAELMLKRSFAPDKQREFLTIIHQEATRLTGLINDFLDLQRMQSGRQVYNMTEIALEPLLRESATIFVPDQSRHVLQIEIDPSLPAVCVDVDCIRQVLGNLLSNAVKFSPRGGSIYVHARSVGKEVWVMVTDQGVGIPQEALSQLFTKFFRVDNADTRSIGGTGLGLALVKEIVETHGGRVWVESTRGEGSTFSFSLPAVPPALRSEELTL